MEDSLVFYRMFLWATVETSETISLEEEHIDLLVHYGQSLKQLVLTGAKDFDEDGPIYLLDFCISKAIEKHFPVERMEMALRVTLASSGDVNAVNAEGKGLLHLLFQRQCRPEEKHYVVAFARLLLRYGASPYALNYFGGSILDYAKHYGRTAEWYEALRRAGYDANDVEAYIEWRQWLFLNPNQGTGESTSVDGDQIAPSTDGLTQRRSIRKGRDDD